MASAAPKLMAMEVSMPDLANAKPPFKPKAINRYKDKNLAIDRGISKLDLKAPATTPNTKKRIAGSNNVFIKTS